MREPAQTERLFLRAPEQGKIDPSGEGHNGQVWRLAAFSIASTTLGDKNPSGISRRTSHWNGRASRWKTSTPEVELSAILLDLEFD